MKEEQQQQQLRVPKQQKFVHQATNPDVKHSIGITSAGQHMSWGDKNKFGQLGRRTTLQPRQRQTHQWRQ